MTEYDGEIRPLPFPLGNPIAYSAQTEDDGDCEPSSFVWPEDSDEKVPVLFMLSLNEYNVLANTIDVGSDIAYGEDALQVTWLWLRNFRCNMNFCAMVAAAINDCDDVRDAIWGAMMAGIGNNAAVQGAFADWFLSSEAIQNVLNERYLGQPSVIDGAIEQNLIIDGACSNDLLFNQTSTLVTLLHELSIDLFQAIEVGTNALERAEQLSSAIPLWGQLVPADELIGFADDLIENAFEDYNGAYDAAMYDTLRCELFCIAQQDCDLSIDDVMRYYEEKLGQELLDPVQVLRFITQYIIAGDYPTDAVVYVMHLACVALIQAGQNVLGIDFSRLALRVAAASDTPNNDWTLLCDACPTEICVDLTTGANGWFGGDENGNPTTAFGSWISGEGIAPNQTTGGFNVGIDAGDMPVGSITALKLIFNQNIEDGLYMARWGSDAFQYNPDVSDTIVYNALNTTSYFPFDSEVSSVRITSGTNIMPTSLRLIGVCYTVG